MTDSDLLDYLIGSVYFTDRIEVTPVEIVVNLEKTVHERFFLQQLMEDVNHDFYIIKENKYCFKRKSKK